MKMQMYFETKTQPKLSKPHAKKIGLSLIGALCAPFENSFRRPCAS